MFGAPAGIRPPAGGPGRGSDVPLARYSPPLPSNPCLHNIKNIPPCLWQGGNIFGAPAGIRTLDTRLKRAVLYLLSYWGRYINFFHAPRESEESYRRGWDGGTRTHYIGVKVRCVTITLHPIISYEPRPAAPASIILYMGWDMGLEPTTPGTTIRCSAN